MLNKSNFSWNSLRTTATLQLKLFCLQMPPVSLFWLLLLFCTGNSTLAEDANHDWSGSKAKLRTTEHQQRLFACLI